MLLRWLGVIDECDGIEITNRGDKSGLHCMDGGMERWRDGNERCGRVRSRKWITQSLLVAVAEKAGPAGNLDIHTVPPFLGGTISYNSFFR